MQRTLWRCDQRTKAQAYTTFVRPIVEYASTVWDPHNGNKSQVKQLEATQSKAARFACGDWRRTESVSAMKAQLQWLSLQERRAKARILMMHKIYYQTVAIPLAPYFPISDQAHVYGSHTRHVKRTTG